MNFPDRERVRRDPARVAAVENLRATAETRQELDRLARLVSETLGVPAAFVSLVGGEVDEYVGAHGFPAELQQSRRLDGTTFCHYTLVADGILAVEDARAHDTLSTVPTVKTLGVVAYLGIPLRSTDDQVVGAVCAIDTRPHRWSESEIDAVVSVARVALTHLQAAGVDAEGDARERSPFERSFIPVVYALFLRILRDESAAERLLVSFVDDLKRRYGPRLEDDDLRPLLLRDARARAVAARDGGASERPIPVGEKRWPETLTARERQLLSLAYFDGLDIRRIAASTSESIESVRSSLSAAMKKLRESSEARHRR